jgi:hypothetical protein
VSGFARKPVRGDGYSLKRAKEVLAKNSLFKFDSPETVANEAREEDPKLEALREKRVGTFTKEELFTPKKEFETFEVESKDIKGRIWLQGYWSAQLFTRNDDKNKGTVDWQIAVQVATEYVYRPKSARKYVVKNLGEEVYNEFKAAVLDDLDSLKECLNEACETLDLKKKVALSYVTSPSSERLLKRLEIRVEREWAFLFPHYKF